MKHFKRYLPFMLAALAVLLDQLTKHLAVLFLKGNGSLPILNGIFHLTYTTNPGAAFSMFSAPDQRWIFMLISTVAILLMTGYLLLDRSQSCFFRCAIGAVLGGGIGNMIDRVAVGEVVDFLDFCLINFPIFNVADCFVTVGACLLFLAFLLDWRREVLEKRAAEAPHDADRS